MANTIDWGQGAVNNTNGFGKAPTNNTIDFGEVCADSWSPETNLTGASAAALLLDTYSGASVAYSLRKLSSTYSGSAIRVRRSSDNTEQDISFTSNVLDTASLLSFVGSNDGYVTTWYDQSGNSANATMATAVNQPRIVSSGSVDVVNGKSAILGDGINDSLRYSGLSLTNPITNFMVNDKVGNTGYFGIFTSVHGFGGAYDLETTGIRAYQNGSAFTPIYANNNQSLISFKSATSGTDWDLYGNGTQVTNSGENIGTLAGTIISLFDRSNNTNRTNMYMQEYIVYDADKFSNRADIESNINTYYSIY